MMKVELIYEASCPNIELARTRLRQALHDAGGTIIWQEWDIGAAGTPENLRNYGSPTILVDGKDVSGDSPSPEGDCCRVYATKVGYDLAPSLKQIADALS